MALITKYVRKGQLYSHDNLKSIFEFADKDEFFGDFIRLLKKYRILKTVKGKKNTNAEDESLLDETDDDYVGVLDDYSDLMYLFRYVGILSCKDRVIYVYPKYIETTSSIPKKEMLQIINVLRKYNKSRKEIIREYTGKEGKNNVNVLSLMLFLIRDYLSNGIYSNVQEIIEINGSTDYLWQKTIDETYPIIKNNRPYYTEIYTVRKDYNENDFIHRLHSWIITDCTLQLHEAGLSDIYNYPIIELTTDKKRDFGDDTYILNCIENELRIQFDDHKIMLLKAMADYIAMRGKMRTGDTVMLLLGTRTFHTVWEDVCAKVFESQRNETLSELGKTYKPVMDFVIMNPLTGKQELVELIKKPRWNYLGADREPQNTFIPDFLSFYEDKSTKNYYYYILDAKYYCPEFNGKSIRKNPGVEDVAKQYLYYLAYKYFLDDIKIPFSDVKNYFLMPKETGIIEDVGYVELELWNSVPSMPRLVRVKKLPADLMYEKYINDETLPLTDLDK
jgi:hypothetical protein